MNKSHLITTSLGFVAGYFTSSAINKKTVTAARNGQKISVTLPHSTSDLAERIPKAISAAASEIVDEKVIQIENPERNRENIGKLPRDSVTNMW